MTPSMTVEVLTIILLILLAAFSRKISSLRDWVKCASFIIALTLTFSPLQKHECEGAAQQTVANIAKSKANIADLNDKLETDAAHADSYARLREQAKDNLDTLQSNLATINNLLSHRKYATCSLNYA
ncbi:hypothetical protein AWB71_05309 [Caballeronia peredens]|nr:hypothetical protein AWB71_05309 [Caballeronia peredens]